VNQGHIFRFLTKPCAPDDLMEALLSGIKEYRRAHKERKFNKRTRRSLAQAMDVQQSLMPSSRPDLDGMDIAGRSVFCDQTGGDYYDYFEKGADESHRISIVVGDVSDHGLPSALLMATARAFLRQSAFSPGSISSVVERVNRELTRDVQTSGRFVTLFYAEIDPTAAGLRWVRAGHEPALLFDEGTGVFEELNGQGGLPLGVIEDAVYKENQRRLRPGQLIAIGTDGIWEARNREGCMFGKLRLQQAIREKAHQPAAEIVQGVLESLKQFLFPLAIQDDATLVVVKLERR
jgi:phosphoserine phosphatase RsbU/P